MHRLLLDKGQDVVQPAGWLPLAVAQVGIAGPIGAPAVGRQPLGGAFMVQAAQASCFTLLAHCDIRAASRAACTAGSSRAIRMPMIVMTTRSSTSVKPRRVSLTIKSLSR